MAELEDDGAQAPTESTPASGEMADLPRPAPPREAEPEGAVDPGGSLLSRISAFNRRREPDRLALKYARMRASPLGFYRATAHLFYEDLPCTGALHEGPAVWSSGDLHLENFGAYKGENRLVYFDITDFDEAILAPAPVELARFVTSVLLGARGAGLTSREAVSLGNLYLRAYGAALQEGKPGWLERPASRGIVKDLIRGVRKRSRRKLLNERTEVAGRNRRLVIDHKRTLPVAEVARQRIAAYMRKFAARQPEPDFFRLLDVARRTAGTSSLGLPRFALLVQGYGSPDGNFLLDLKAARPPAGQDFVATVQPAWRHQAERIVSVQSRMQGVTPALLHGLLVNRQPYVLREMQPSADRVTLDLWRGKRGRLERLLTTMGQLTAWAQLRSSGRQNSAITDELIAFGRDTAWHQAVMAYARFYAARMEMYYAEYCGLFDSGALEE